MKAILSWCLGSILAWILKIKPVSLPSDATTSRSSATRDRGVGAHSVKPSSMQSTPKLPKAVPKNTGVNLPSRNRSKSNSFEAPLQVQYHHVTVKLHPHLELYLVQGYQDL